jgi:hypothetical protein
VAEESEAESKKKRSFAVYQPKFSAVDAGSKFLSIPIQVVKAQALDIERFSFLIPLLLLISPSFFVKRSLLGLCIVELMGVISLEIRQLRVREIYKEVRLGLRLGLKLGLGFRVRVSLI